jgi:hypothetical protein
MYCQGIALRAESLIEEDGMTKDEARMILMAEYPVD